MNFYEECLTLGYHLTETERVALYKFQLESKSAIYSSDARKLMSDHVLKREIANGEILYSLNKDVLSFSVKRKGSVGYIENLRILKVSKLHFFRLRKVVRFFAQAEVDVIWNYPVPGNELGEEDGSFSIISTPYFDVRYFSDSRNLFLGIINKLRFKDAEILELLRAS